MNRTMTNPVLLNEDKASEMIGLKVATLRKRRWAGDPPKFLKVGSRVFYRREDLEEFLRSCERTSTTKKD